MFIKIMEIKRRPYTSCIKINGKPILPPLVRDEDRKQIRQWKREAIEKETNRSVSTNLNVQTPSNLVPLMKTKESEKLPLETLDINVSRLTLKRRTSDPVSPQKFTDFFASPTDENKNPCEDHNNKMHTPRLIRSNSYTLDSPSPALLAYLKSQPDCTWESSKYKEQSCVSKSSSYERINAVDKLNKLEIVTTIQCNILPDDSQNTLLDSDHVSNHSNQIDLLLDRQREEQQQLLDSFGKLKSALMDQFEYASPVNNKTSMERRSPRINQSTPITPEQSSQTLFYSFDQSDTDTSPNVQLLIDFDDNYVIREPHHNVLETRHYIEDIETIFLSTPPPLRTRNDSSDTLKCSEKSVYSNSSRKLFLENNINLQIPTEQTLAASKICAGVKGYLTRRLLHTERVEILIQTIRDSLICAMKLHQECREDIEVADVELHRRLTQQVASACYAFHEIFFKLTIPEQMSIIAMDREHRKEKELRRIKNEKSL